ncbi:MAG TPA: response regulator transcription factor [Balneolaceae bacterium]|nr:response regulator transcription factor [Balneolaceae bacterium]
MVHSFKKRIVIVDDHPLMRKGLASTLEAEPGYEVIAQFEKAEDVLDNFEKLEADLVIVDVSLPGMSGIELVKNLLFQFPDFLCLVVSRHEVSLYAERALRAGAKGYVMKFESSAILLKAVRKILNGGIFVSEEISEKLLQNAMTGKSGRSESPIDVLSDRELEVFDLTGRGKSSSEIAEQLHLAIKTIETYRFRIKEKLNLKNSTELIYYAVKWVENEKFVRH